MSYNFRYLIHLVKIIVLVFPIVKLTAQEIQPIQLKVLEPTLTLSGKGKTTITIELSNQSEVDYYFAYNLKDLIMGTFIEEGSLCEHDSIFINGLYLVLKDTLGNVISPGMTGSPTHKEARAMRQHDPKKYSSENEFSILHDETLKVKIKTSFFSSFHLYQNQYEFIICFISGSRLKEFVKNYYQKNFFNGCTCSNKVKVHIQ